MSVEIRRNHENDGWECDWGPIEHPDPLPDHGRVGPLMVMDRDYFGRLFKKGPRPRANGSVDSVTTVPVDQNGRVIDRDEDIAADTELRLFVHVEHGSQRWTWELFEAHWWDDKGPKVYVGRWPD